MLNSAQRLDAPMTTQVDFWNTWNAEAREAGVGQVSLEQADCIARWLQALQRTDLDILDVGCGAGWLSARLAPFGNVTGTDLSDQVLQRAAVRWPNVRFVAGDFMRLDFPESAYDAVVLVEVLSHVADQPALLGKIARLLRPGGQLMLATQNRPALQRNDIPAPAPGQIRKWVDSVELRDLLSADFDVAEIFSITPTFNRGILRYLNSQTLNRAFSKARLTAASRMLKQAQERAGLGWTLMARATRKA